MCCTIVAMNPDEMLKQAKAVAKNLGLEKYAETIWELRRKGFSYRQIAEFLNERGMTTEHTAVYRLVTGANPEQDYMEFRVLLGKVEYEFRNGRPLRPFNDGLFIAITRKLNLIMLKDTGRIPDNWCEAQFELNNIPNHLWIYQLSKCLHIKYNPEQPFRLVARAVMPQGIYRFELKFEGNLMAVVCLADRLEMVMNEVATCIKESTQFFGQYMNRPSQWEKMLSNQKDEIFERLLVGSKESEENPIRVSKYDRELAEEMAKRFNSFQIP